MFRQDTQTDPLDEAFKKLQEVRKKTNTTEKAAVSNTQERDFFSEIVSSRKKPAALPSSNGTEQTIKPTNFVQADAIPQPEPVDYFSKIKTAIPLKTGQNFQAAPKQATPSYSYRGQSVDRNKVMDIIAKAQSMDDVEGLNISDDQELMNALQERISGKAQATMSKGIQPQAQQVAKAPVEEKSFWENIVDGWNANLPATLGGAAKGIAEMLDISSTATNFVNPMAPNKNLGAEAYTKLKRDQETGQRESTAPGLESFADRKFAESEKYIEESGANTDSWGYLIGGLGPQTAGIATAIGVGAVNPLAGAAIGYANMAGLSAMAMGMSAKEYDDYVAQTGQEYDPNARLGAMMLATAAEMGSEAIPVAKFVPKAFKGKLGKMIFGGPDMTSKAGKELLEEFAKSNSTRRKLVDRTLREMGEGALTEGPTEVAAELGQEFSTWLYKEKEDRSTFNEIVENTFKAMAAGSLMGSALGPLSYGAQTVQNQRRRKAAGKVTIAQDRNSGEAVEVVGIINADKDGQPNPGESIMYEVIRPNGKRAEVAEDVLTNNITLPLDTFNNLMKGKEAGNQALEAKTNAEIAQVGGQERDSIIQQYQGYTFTDQFGDPNISIGTINGDEFFITGPTQDKQGIYVINRETNEKKVVSKGIIENVTTLPFDQFVEQLSPVKQETIAPFDPSNPIQKGESINYEGEEWLVTGVNIEEGIVQLESATEDGFFEQLPLDVFQQIRQEQPKVDQQAVSELEKEFVPEVVPTKEQQQKLDANKKVSELMPGLGAEKEMEAEILKGNLPSKSPKTEKTPEKEGVITPKVENPTNERKTKPESAPEGQKGVVQSGGVKEEIISINGYFLTNTPSLKDYTIEKVDPAYVDKITINKDSWDKAIKGGVKALNNGWYEIDRTVDGGYLLYAPSTNEAVIINRQKAVSSVAISDFTSRNPRTKPTETQPNAKPAPKAPVTEDVQRPGEAKTDSGKTGEGDKGVKGKAETVKKPVKGQILTNNKNGKKGTVTKVSKPAKGTALENESYIVDITYEDGKKAMNMPISQFSEVQEETESEPTPTNKVGFTVFGTYLTGTVTENGSILGSDGTKYNRAMVKDLENIDSPEAQAKSERYERLIEKETEAGIKPRQADAQQDDKPVQKEAGQGTSGNVGTPTNAGVQESPTPGADDSKPTQAKAKRGKSVDGIDSGVKEISKEDKLKDELKDLWNQFGSGNQLRSGVSGQDFEIAGKIIAKSAELGMVKFEQMINWAKENLGSDSFKQKFDSFRAAYVARLALNNPENEDLNTIAKRSVNEFIKENQSEKPTISDIVKANPERIIITSIPKDVQKDKKPVKEEPINKQPDGTQGQGSDGEIRPTPPISNQRTGTEGVSENEDGRDVQEVPTGKTGGSKSDDGQTEGTGVQRGPSGGTGDGKSDGKRKPTGNKSGGKSDLEKRTKKKIDNSKNFVIEEGFKYPDTFKKAERFDANIKALNLLVEMIKDGRTTATAEEKNILFGYSGFGGLAEIATPTFYRFESEVMKNRVEKVRDLVKEIDPDGSQRIFENIKASINTAHYTEPELIRAHYDVLAATGFTNGRILDPSAGIGNYFGTTPEAISKNSVFEGVELDFLTSEIFKRLYPSSKITNTGLQEANISENAYDLVLSNIPFGDTKVYDASWKGKKDPVYRLAQQKIHNYFVVKMIESAREGGLVSILTSNAVMDTPGNRSIRQYMADNTDFIGAVRLPNTAFQGSSGTKVVTDVIFLRKRKAGEVVEQRHSFVESKPQTKDGSRFSVNQYFIDNPNNILGNIEGGGQYSRESGYTVTGEANNLRGRIFNLLKDEAKLYPYKPVEIEATKEIVKESYTGDKALRAGNIFYKNGEFFEALNKDASGNWEGDKVNVFKKFEAPLRDYTIIRDTLNELIDRERAGQGDDVLNPLRKFLKGKYDQFVKSHGRINDFKNVFSNDIDHYQVLNLEILDKKGEFKGLADIFTKRTISPYIRPSKADSPQEAILISMNEYNRVNAVRMEELLGEDWLDQSKGLIYTLPDGSYESKDQYLSGDIYQKIEQVDGKKGFEENLAALKEVLPQIIPIEQITVPLGARYVDTDVYSEFLQEELGFGGYYDGYVQMNYLEGSDSYKLNKIHRSPIYETNRVNTNEIVQKAFSDQTIRVVDTIKTGDGSTTTVFNETATLEANNLVEKLKKAWQVWLSQKAEYGKTIEAVYNRLFNSTVKRKFDGSSMTFPGLRGLSLRPHQKDGINMIVQNNGGVIDHIVGAGKTFIMVVGSMELKRLGVAKKPLIIVKKSTIGQIADSFRSVYPGSKILAPTEDDFSAKNRKKLLSKIALNDWDAVILSHENFGSIMPDPNTAEKVFNDEIDLLQVSIEDLKGRDSSKMSKREMKGMEKRIENLTAKLQSLVDTKKDEEILDFGKLGIDHIMVDESQSFKNLTYTTVHNNVAGLGSPTGVQKTFNLLIAVRYLQKIHKGDKGTTFLSGTPISNTMAELYLILKYLRPSRIRDLGISTFDAWAKTFAEKSSELEFGVSGALKAKERFRKFINVPELAKIYTDIADIRNDQNLSLPKPKMKGGQENFRLIQPGKSLEKFYKKLVHYAQTGDGSVLDIPGLDYSSDEAKKAKMLKVTDLATKAAIDLRLIYPQAPYDPSSKLATVAGDVAIKYKETTKNKGVSLVFMDSGKTSQYNISFNGELALRDMLSKQYEIPKDQIALMSDNKTDQKKKDLFKKVNSGAIRILIGSTETMGTGVNVQERVVSMHHVDIPWRPSDYEQRNGRGLRQGNLVAEEFYNNEVDVFVYGVERSLDAYKFELLKIKQAFIDQLKNGATTQRIADEGAGDEESGASFADFMAAATGNPVIKEKAKNDKLIDQLISSKTAFFNRIGKAKSDVSYNQASIANNEAVINQLNRFQAIAEKSGVLESYPISVQGKTFEKPTEAGEALLKVKPYQAFQIDVMKKGGDRMVPHASVLGWDLYKFESPGFNQTQYLIGVTDPSTGRYLFPKGGELSDNAVYAINAIKSFTKGISDQITKNQAGIEDYKNKIANSQKVLSEKWQDEEKFIEALEDQKRIAVEIEAMNKQKSEKEGQDESIREPMFSGSDISLSLKPTSTPSKPSPKISKIQKVADRITKGWANKTPITVVKDVAEARELYPNYNWTGVEDGQVAGFYDKINRRVVIVGSHPMADNGAHIESVIFHEMIGHHGVRQLIKQAIKDQGSLSEMNRKWDGLMDSIFAKNWNSPLMRSISQTYFGTSETSSLNPSQMRYLAEEYVAHKAEQMDFGGTIDKIVAFIRNLMRQMGMTLSHTDAEIRNMLSNARRLVIDGTTATVREVDSESLPDTANMAPYRSISPESEQWRYLEVIDGFYSPIEKRLLEFKQEKASATKWKEIVGKKDEAQWTGVYQYLDGLKPDQQVTRKELMDWMKDNRVKIEVVEKFDVSEEDIDALLEDELGQDMDRDDAREYLGNEENAPKFSQYQLEGDKTDYKEVLVTLPVKPKGDNKTPSQLSMEKFGKSSIYDLKPWQQKEVMAEYEIQVDAGREMLKSQFKSSHFDEPNILVHLRMNTRTDSEGNKVLFLEEIQSDWGQKGKKEGFRTDKLPSNIKIREVDGKWQVIKDGKLEGEYKSEERAKEFAMSDYTVLSAPFVTSTPSWVKLGLKVAIQEAVAQGADKIAWTTGEQQNERYDLSKQINLASAKANGDGTYKLVVEDKQGFEIDPYKGSGKTVTASEMEDTVGKDLTNKLIQGADSRKGAPWPKNVKNNPEYFTVSGIDLKIGGSGMKGFYDGIVPSVMKSITGQEVGTVELQNTSTGIQSQDKVLRFRDWVWKNKTEDYSFADAKNDIDSNSDLFKEYKLNIPSQPSINITDQLRDEVERGLPLFMKSKDQTQSPAFKAWFGDSKVVDKRSGKPRVVFHGSNKNFFQFEAYKSTPDFPEAMYFSSNRKVAETYSDNIYEVYLKIENPYYMNADNKDFNTVYDMIVRNMNYAVNFGHDGLIIENIRDDWSQRGKGPKGTTFVTFSPTQIKSATGNQGTFDASNPDIRFSLSPTPQQVANRKKTFMEQADAMYESYVDYMLHARKLVKSKLKGREISDAQDFVVKENLAKSKTRFLTDQFLDDIWNPFLKVSSNLKKDFGVDNKQISDYFYALHHPERKAYFIDKYNQEGRKLPKDDRWPTGMSDAESDQIIQDFETAVPQDRRDEVTDYVRQMTELVNARRLATGIISKETYDQLTAQYSNYVPLRGFEDLMGIDDTVYSPLMSAKGRESKAASPIPYLFTAVQEAIIRGENNVVRQSVLEFVKEYPDKEGGDYFIRNGYYVKTGAVDADGNEVWVEQLEKPTAKQIKAGDAKRSFDELTHKHVKLFGEPDNTLMVYVNGRRVFIEFKDSGIVKAIKNTSQDKVDGKVMKHLASFTRTLSSLRTQYSPEFGITNLLRDIGFGSFAILAEKDFKTYKSTMSKMGKSGKTLGNYFWTGKFDENNPDSMMAKEWLSEGGMTGFTDLKEAKEIFEQAQKEIDGISRGKFKEGVEFLKESKLGRALETYNKTLESMIRFSYYKALVEQGVSKQSAAIQSKDLTVNFNRKGNSTSFVGSIYMFFNASVQGTERLVKLFTNPKTRRKALMAMGTVMAAGFMQGMLFGLFGDDDDDEKGFYAKIPDYVRRTNIILPWFGKGNYLKIPMPYGVNTFYVFGESMASAIFSDKDPGREAIGLLSAVSDSFSPIGGFDFESDANFFQKSIMLFSPTIARPIGELAFNQNFAGGQIYRENFTKGQYQLPNSQMYFPGVNPIAKGFTEGLRVVSGGDKVESGLVEINPEWVEHGFTTYLGGPASFSNSIISTGSAVLSGENVFEDPFYRKIPFVRRFFLKAGGQYDTQRRFYDRYNELKEIHDRLNIYKKTRPETLEKFYQENGKEIELFNMASSMRESVGNVNDGINALKAQPQTKELQEEIETLYDQKDAIMKEFNRQYNIKMKKEN